MAKSSTTRLRQTLKTLNSNFRDELVNILIQTMIVSCIKFWRGKNLTKQQEGPIRQLRVLRRWQLEIPVNLLGLVTTVMILSRKTVRQGWR